jgi:hypothetical protein
MRMNLHGSPTLEPGRPVYVLLHKDETHVASLPDGSADWDYDRATMELRQKILEKDFNNFSYGVCPLVEALTRISNKQAQLEEEWKPAIILIKKTKKLEEAWGCYVAAKKKIGPHPLRFDSYLKQKFGI